jgi:hypothetical protein
MANACAGHSDERGISDDSVTTATFPPDWSEHGPHPQPPLLLSPIGARGRGGASRGFLATVMPPRGMETRNDGERVVMAPPVSSDPGLIGRGEEVRAVAEVPFSLANPKFTSSILDSGGRAQDRPYQSVSATGHSWPPCPTQIRKTGGKEQEQKNHSDLATHHPSLLPPALCCLTPPPIPYLTAARRIRRLWVNN